MDKININGLPLWQYQHLSTFKNIGHFVSGRHGGVSLPPFDSLNLSLSAGDRQEDVRINRSILEQAMSLSPGSLIFASQIHSDKIKVICSIEDAKGVEADALMTDTPGICMAVMAADCVPVLVYDSQKQVVAAIHAGWRGTVQSITSKTIYKMKQEFGSDPNHLYVGIGPSAGQQKYEVGQEVYDQFQAAFGRDADGWFKFDTVSQKYFPDLWKANRD